MSLRPSRFSQFLAKLAIILLASGCGPPTQVPPSMPVTPTSTTPPAAAPSSSQTAETQLYLDIDGFMAALVEQDQFSGSLLVAKDGKVLISKGYGMANIEVEVPNTPQTKFRLGSVTKQFTAMAILQLQQQGKLNVQDPICRYIQDCPEAWQPITIHHLLTHTSGIHNFTTSSSYAELKKQSTSVIKIVEQFRDLPLDFVPGERWSYSNSGYIVLGHIIEEVSGQPYAIFLQNNIFEPLQMADTGYDDNRKVITHRAAGYSNTTVNADYIDMSIPYAAGGLYSTVEDVFLWEQALYTGKLIPLSPQNQMFTPFVPIPVDARATMGLSPNTGESYGYGWRIGKQFDRLWIAHGGGIEGFAAKFDRYPDDKVTIIVLSNLESARAGDIALEIARMIFAAR